MDNRLLLLGLLAFAFFMGSGYSDPGDVDTETQTTPNAYCNGAGFVDADGDGICDNSGSGSCGGFVDEDGDGINDNAGAGCGGGCGGRGYGRGPR